MWATASIIKGYEIFPDKIVVVRLFARKEILSGLIVSVRMDSIGLDKSIRACT